jgi:hypothetical protein
MIGICPSFSILASSADSAAAPLGSAEYGAKNKAGTRKVPACVKNSDSCGSGCLAAAADYAKRDETGAQQSEAGRLGHRGYAHLKKISKIAVAGSVGPYETAHP